MKIVIYKGKRTLECLGETGTIMTARTQLGFGAEGGAKSREGDGKTPEGTYRVCARNPRSKYHLSLGISYPGLEDARRAADAGALSPGDCARVAASPDRPPWDTPLGGFIMIHGQPEAGACEGDWTAGCVAVSNAHMDALWALSRVGDEVEIVP